MLRIAALMLLISFLLSGCVSVFERHYQGIRKEDLATYYELTTCVTPRVRGLPHKSYDEICDDLFEEGYHVIGSSFFTHEKGYYSSRDALALGKALGACLVLYGENDAGSYIDTRVETVPTKTVQYHSGKTKIKDESGKYKKGTYKGKTTTHGTETRVVQYTVFKVEYIALYAVKLERDSLGILAREAPDHIKRKLDTYDAIVVKGVQRGSSAYQANIFREDIIISINGRPADINYFSLLRSGKNTFKILRDGRILKKVVIIPEEESIED